MNTSPLPGPHRVRPGLHSPHGARHPLRFLVGLFLGGALTVGSTVSPGGSGALRPAHAGPPLPTFTFVPLGTGGGAQSGAFGINNNFDVCGITDTVTDTRAFNVLNNPLHAIQFADLLNNLTGGTLGQANAINAAGLSVGNTQGTGISGQGHGVFWAPGSASPVDVGTLGGPTSVLRGVSDGGIAVGLSRGAGGFDRAAMVDIAAGGGLVPLGLPAPYTSVSVANSISPNGMFVVGAAQNPTRSGDFDAFLINRSAGTTTALPLLKGFPNGTAIGVNNVGTVVGTVQQFTAPGSPQSMPVVWFPTGAGGAYEVAPVFTTPTGNFFGQVNAINADGDFVGDQIGPGPSFTRTCFARINGTLFPNANSLLPAGTPSGTQLLTCTDIADGDAFCGTTQLPSGSRQAYVMKPLEIPGKQADIGVSIATAGTLTRGTRATIRVTTRNLGPAATNAVRLRITLGQNSTLPLFEGRLDTTNAVGQTVTIEPGPPQVVEVNYGGFGGSIAPGGARVFEITALVSVLHPLGTVPLTVSLVSVNPPDPVLGNNSGTAEAQVQDGPAGNSDVQTTLKVTPASAGVGKKIKVEATLKNAGPDVAGGGVVTLNIPAFLGIGRISVNPAATVARPQPGRIVATLQRDLRRNGTAKVSVDLTPTAPGQGAVTVDADSNNGDANDGNNHASVNVRAQGPDLVSSGLSAQFSTRRGTVTIRAMVRNAGAGDSEAFNARLIVRLPTTPPTDIILRELDFRALRAGGTVPIKLTIPPPPGTNIAGAMILLVLDPKNEIAEDNETNNTASTPLLTVP